MDAKSILKKIFYGNVDKNFYGHHNKLIDTINQRTTKLLYILSFIFCAILSLVYLVPGNTNEMAVFYVIYSFLFGIVCILAFFLLNKHQKSTHILYWVFEVLATVNLLYVSVYNEPDSLAVTFFVIMMIMIVLYVGKPWQSILEETIAYVAFVILDIIVKKNNSEILRQDLINAAIFYAVNFAAIVYVRNLHVEALNASILFKKEAQIDKLTNIFNKSSMETYVKELLGQTHGNLALIIMDIDDFKLVNDRWGHNQGDRFLTQVSRVLSKNFQGSGILGRIGGDEFMILAENIYDHDLVIAKINNTIDAISKSFSDFSNEKITCSCGVAFLNEGEVSSFDELYKEADRALYLAKDRGKNQCVIYKPFDDKNKYPLLLALTLSEDDEAFMNDFLRDQYNLLFAKENQIDVKFDEFRANLRGIVFRYDSKTCPPEVFKNKVAGLSKFKQTLIVLSDDPTIESDCLKLGADEFILLPSTKDVVLLRIKNALRKRA